MESPEIIDAWLKTATQGLCGAAKERIALEIKAHFNDAVAAHVADAQSLASAQALALGELGDANAANKRFRKRHLTTKQNKFVNQQTTLLLKKQSELVFYITGLACVVGAFVIYHFDKISREKFLVIYALVFIQGLSWIYCRRLMQRLSDKIVIKRISLIMSANAFMGMFVVILLSFFRRVDFFPVLFFMLTPLGQNFKWVPIYFKMRNDRTLAA